jgi:hypothetical protein
MIEKGYTYKYDIPNSTEGAGSVYQNVFLSFIAASLFDKKFYFYENYINKMGEKTAYEVYAARWKKIFNFIIARSDFLQLKSDELILPYKALSKYPNLNYPAIVNLEFHDSYRILINNYSVYREKFHPLVTSSYSAHCEHIPEENLYSSENFNIAIHLRTAMPEDSWGDDGLKWANYFERPDEVPYSRAYEFFNIDYKIPTENPKYYSKLYAHLLNHLGRIARSKQSKPVVVHIFSRGNEKIFDLLAEELERHLVIKYHLEVNTADTFFHLTKADFLVCAKSSLSWLASYLNPNFSFMRYPFRHALSPSGYYFLDDLRMFNERR